ALENKYSLAAYHLILKTGIYKNPPETATKDNESVIFRQWEFDRVDKLMLNYSFTEFNGIMAPTSTLWPRQEYYVLGVTPNEQGKFKIGSHEVPVKVLLYVAEHDPKRRLGTDIILALSGAGEVEYDDAILDLHKRIGVRIWAPEKGGAHLLRAPVRGVFSCYLVDRNEGGAVDWMETDASISGTGAGGGASEGGVPADGEDGSDVQVSDRVFTDVTGTVRFTVDEVERRSVMSADGERVIGVSTTPGADTPLVRGDALHGIDAVGELMEYDGSGDGTISTPLEFTPGAVLVYAGRGGNVLLRLTGDRDIELYRAEAALLFGEIPELRTATRRLRSEESTAETSLLLLNGNLPEEGEPSHTQEPPGMGELVRTVFDVRLQYAWSDALIEVRERGKIRARPTSTMGEDDVIEVLFPGGLSRELGGHFASSDELAEFVTMIKFVSRMRSYSGERRMELESLTDESFAARVMIDYTEARPHLAGVTDGELRSSLVEEVLAEASENGSLGLYTFLRIPILYGIDELPVSGESIEGGPGVPIGSVETRRVLVNLVRTGLSNDARLEFINALQAVYRIIPPSYHRLEDPEKRLRAYLDRAWAHATAPGERELTAIDKSYQRNYRRTIQFISDAQRAGRAGSDAALTAYLLERGGLFQRVTLGTASPDEAVLRDFSGRVVDSVPLYKSVYRWSEVNIGLDRGRSVAPWGGGPYIFTAETVRGLFVIDWAVHGWEVLAELVAHDPARRDGADIVAAVPRLGANDRRFQRRLATLAKKKSKVAGTGVTVWAHDGDITIGSRTGQDSNTILLVMAHRTGEYTRWIPATAADDFPAEWDGLRVRTVDGESVSVSDLVLTTALRGDGRDVLG
ncbi:hypothetical protein, partial [Streptomyces zaomyceticus]|uniref:hypothetical protein n=1 Tax=Streptomyces zaomyceticus TaxID=68286 RepID=UPI00369251C2